MADIPLYGPGQPLEIDGAGCRLPPNVSSQVVPQLRLSSVRSKSNGLDIPIAVFWMPFYWEAAGDVFPFFAPVTTAQTSAFNSETLS